MTPDGTCHAEASIELDLDLQDAWDVVADWPRQSRWMLFTRVWATEQDGRGIGGGVSARTSVGGIGFTDDMVITHWDPPNECTVKHLGKIVRGTGTFAVQQTSRGSSVFTWSEDVIPPFGKLGRLVWPIVRPAFEVMMRISLKRLVKEVAA
ncbi:SRPBCC family protein [Kribbella yunnanensis]|uniref:SRPBCC family protein n=1 Tax=Kribbella yunnanensis TaxID=190194 RepID=A0ABP4TCR7_9ACTN